MLAAFYISPLLISPAFDAFTLRVYFHASLIAAITPPSSFSAYATMPITTFIFLHTPLFLLHDISFDAATRFELSCFHSISRRMPCFYADHC